MESQKGPATSAQDGLKELQKKLNKDDITVLAFFDDKYDKRFDVYESFSKCLLHEWHVHVLFLNCWWCLCGPVLAW